MMWGGLSWSFVFIRFRKSLLVFVLLFFSVRGLLLQVSYKGLIEAFCINCKS